MSPKFGANQKLLGLTGNYLVRSCQEPIISDVQFFLGWNCFVRHPLFARTHFGHFCWQHLPSPRWLTKQETPEKCQFITFGKNIENLRPKIQVSLQRRTQSKELKIYFLCASYPLLFLPTELTGLHSVVCVDLPIGDSSDLLFRYNLGLFFLAFPTHFKVSTI